MIIIIFEAVKIVSVPNFCSSVLGKSLSNLGPDEIIREKGGIERW